MRVGFKPTKQMVAVHVTCFLSCVGPGLHLPGALFYALVQRGKLLPEKSGTVGSKNFEEDGT